MTLNANQDYREFLREAYEARLKRNAKYSLRAFARDLGLAPSRIVEVLNYTRGLSRDGAKRIAQGLGLQNKETETFLNLVDSVHGRSQTIRTRASKALREERSQDHSVLHLDLFKLMSDWYHYAILELTSVEDWQSDEDWIATRLGLSKTVVTGATDRLKRLGLLIEENGSLKARDAMTFSMTDIPSDGLKKHHEQILEKAQGSIYSQSIEQRDLSSMTMAIRSHEMPRAKEMIRKFRREFSAEFEAGNAKDAVYALAIQFFRLDQASPAPKELPQKIQKNKNLNQPESNR